MTLESTFTLLLSAAAALRGKHGKYIEKGDPRPFWPCFISREPQNKMESQEHIPGPQQMYIKEMKLRNQDGTTFMGGSKPSMG